MKATVTRHIITVPAAGAFVEVRSAGVGIVIESGAETEPENVPTLHLETPSADAFPAYPQAVFQNRFERFFVQGTAEAEGSTLYITVLNTPGLTIKMPNTARHPS